MNFDMTGGIQIDEFGRPNGVVCINKPKGKTSHDIVDFVRKTLKTRKVGHAGALDPFAEGLLIILVGKATKLSDALLNKDKTYEAEVILGVATDSGDPTGIITAKSKFPITDESEIRSILNSFTPEYEQFVPVFSSVKVDGNKLRELARRFKSHEIIEESGKPRVVIFKDKNNEIKKEIELPSRMVKVYELELLDSYEKTASDLKKNYDLEMKNTLSRGKFSVLKIRVSCSKGTYIRQLAVDIADKLGTVGMLGALTRTRIDRWMLKDSYTLNEFENYSRDLIGN